MKRKPNRDWALAFYSPVASVGRYWSAPLPYVDVVWLHREAAMAEYNATRLLDWKIKKSQ